jgi:hypothetical protein
MITENQILEELKKINENLSKNNNSLFKNYTAGLFHSFGNFTGTVLIFFMLIYLASQFNLTEIITKSFEKMMSQINWSKVIPVPKIQTPSSY